MPNNWPILFAGALVGIFTIIFGIAYLKIRKEKAAIGFDRNVPDSEILRRMSKYIKPYWKSFLLVLFIMILSIAYELISPRIVGYIEALVVGEFTMGELLGAVAIYASVLVVSLISTYLQSIILQKVGQKILSNLRLDVFTHIESLSHEQLTQIPVGKLVTRVTNDTNAISMMFTNVLVQLFKNAFIVIGVLLAMLLLNYQLTLMVLCFVPFVVLFTVIFRKFARKVYRKVKDGTTDINTFLSENLSGIKITQVFNREDRKMEEFRTKSNALRIAKRNQIFVNGVFRPMVYMLYITSVMCLFYLGAKGHLSGSSFLGQVITGDIVVMFYMYISRFFNPIQNLA